MLVEPKTITNTSANARKEYCLIVLMVSKWLSFSILPFQINLEPFNHSIKVFVIVFGSTNMHSSVINSWIFYPTSNGFLVVTLINNYTLYYRLISVIFFQKQLPSQISQQMLIHIIIISFVYRQLFTKHTWNWVQKFVSWQNLYIYMQSSTWQYKE